MRCFLAMLASLALAWECCAQVSYYNQQLESKPSAQADRDFLGIFGTNITGWGPNPPWATNNIVTSGLTTNIPVIFADTGFTNILNFTNGLLSGINGAAPSHGPSLLLETGGYLLQETGGTFLIE